MTRKAWTTEPQRVWLEGRLATFREAQHAKKTTAVFFPQTQKAFKEMWPLEPPTDEELEKVGGSIEKAIADKNKALNSRIQNWFNNHARATTSGNGTRGLLKLKANPKMLQKWQAYHRFRQTYDTTWKATVDKAWTDFKTEWEAENVDVPIPRSKHFEVINEFIKKTFNEETAEKKEEVEDFRKKLKEEKDEVLNEDQKAEFQIGIDKLPRTLMTVGESIVKQTGWNVSILVGGPMPREGGSLQTYIAHFGKTNDGSDFKDFLGEDAYETNIMDPFDDFIHESFSPDICNSRALGIPDSKENSPGTSGDKYNHDDLAGGGSSSHVTQVTSLAKQKNIVSAILYQFQGLDTEGKKDSEESETPDMGKAYIVKASSNKDDTADISVTPVSEVSCEENGTVDLAGSIKDDIAGTSVTTVSEVPCEENGTVDLAGSNKDDIAGTSVTPDTDIPCEENASGRSKLHAASTIEPQVFGTSVDHVNKPVDLEQDDAASRLMDIDETHNSQVDNQNDAEVSAPLGQPPTTAEETPAPDWLKRMLHYLRGVSESMDWKDLVSALLRFENLNPPSGKLAIDHRPKEVKAWIKARIDKKDIAPKVQAGYYGKSFTKWWTALQPTWRRRVDGTLAKKAPENERWEGLKKGGTAGIYTVVVALSWWIKAVGNVADGGDAFVAVRDITWVLDQVCESLISERGSSGLKRGLDELSEAEGTSKKKRLRSSS